MHDPIRLAVLLSAGGTTLQNLIDRIADGRLRAEIVRVVASRADAFGLERARRAGIPAVAVPRRDFPDARSFSDAIFRHCRESGADLVCLAGFLQYIHIPPDFALRVMNIHPALLPAFGGKGMYGHHVHEAVLEYGAKVSGCTVHFADEQYDHGPVIVQRPVPVLDDDTPETLAERVFAEECEAYPQAITWFAQGRLRVEGRRVRVLSG
ncbi:MAG TPA: phosphoribosylglycinamide formyltransferase [Gemmataceae bacterium]